jgi:hypothetical protein
MAPMARNFAEPLMIDLTCVPATQKPSSPRMVCTTTMVVVTAATDGGLLSPLRESAMRGDKAQNGTIHKRMRNTPTRRRSGDMPADFASSVDDPSRIWIPGSIEWARARTVALHGGEATRCQEHRRPVADHVVPNYGQPGHHMASTLG